MKSAPSSQTLFFGLLFLLCNCDDDVCYSEDCGNKPTDRFLLYDINPPEGFNLRRDVYMRFALLARKLQRSKNPQLNRFKLVLPPWTHLYHWRHSTSKQLPWGLFFDVGSMKRFAPIVEMHEFFDAINRTYNVLIDQVYILQHFEDMFTTGQFKTKMKLEKCLKKYKLSFYHYNNFTSPNIQCVSFHGPATNLDKLLLKTSAKVVLIHHAEVALHEYFGDKSYWRCRRSMRFNAELREIAAEFRRKYLDSTDEWDGTVLPEKWELEEKPERTAKGGSYLAVHLRRRDFNHGSRALSLDDVSKQITNLLVKLELSSVFVATDGSDGEFEEVRERVPKNFNVVRFHPSSDVLEKFSDGGVAIIDQIICSCARFFVGTQDSTFSFRIQEEREIFGFPVESTFNSFCKKDVDCEQPSQWKIVY